MSEYTTEGKIDYFRIEGTDILFKLLTERPGKKLCHASMHSITDAAAPEAMMYISTTGFHNYIYNEEAQELRLMRTMDGNRCSDSNDKIVQVINHAKPFTWRN